MKVKNIAVRCKNLETGKLGWIKLKDIFVQIFKSIKELEKKEVLSK